MNVVLTPSRGYDRQIVRRALTTTISHASRVINLLARSSQKSEPDWHSISEYAAVWQVCLTLWLMTAAESPVRDRRDRAEQLRLLPRIQRLLEVVGHRDQLRFVEGGAVHQHAGRSAGGANSHRHREVRITGNRRTRGIRQVRRDNRVQIL